MTSLALALSDLIDHHGSIAATDRALRWARGRIERALVGDVAPRTASMLVRLAAAIPRCAACGDVLHARWTDATCAACQAAAVEEADASADDGTPACGCTDRRPARARWCTCGSRKPPGRAHTLACQLARADAARAA